ncbi:hypothetical protein [Kribbella sp. NPDC000426]|uniref:hypothetical protein n=1 Tax=Kribbella sp. NPDC000426 TaxID=3154255 RepID=UPI003327E35F
MSCSSVDELLAASGETARFLAGAEQSAWNGRIVESSGAILGLAHWDGTLYLDGETILEPLRELYQHVGERQPTATLVRYRESLATLLHEHAHFLGPSGSTQDAAREAFTKPGSRELEEGVTEAWAQDHLNDYINRLGVDKVAPGIESVQSGGYYAAFVPAVRKLTTDLESRNDLSRGEVINLLNRQTAAGQFPLLVTLAYNSTRLPDLEPAGAGTRSRLESILRAGLDHLDAYELTAPGFAAAKSISTADQLLDYLDKEVRSAESAYTFSPLPTHRTATHPTACNLPTPAPSRQTPSPHNTALPRLTAPSLQDPPPPALALPSRQDAALADPTPAPLHDSAASCLALPPPHEATPPAPMHPSPHAAALSGLAPPSATRGQSARLHPARGRPVSAPTPHFHQRRPDATGPEVSRSS